MQKLRQCSNRLRIWVLLIVLLVAGLVVPMGAGPSVAVAQSSGLPYGDVEAGAFYTAAVSELHGFGVFDGTVLDGSSCPEGFCPSTPIDRKTLAAWIVRVLDGQDPPNAASRFNDVDCCLSGFWPKFIERAAELGVTRGCGDGTEFCPDRRLTRAEAAVFLARAFNLPDGPDPDFADIAYDAWYRDDVGKLKASGITVGCKDGSIFCPNREVTRAQMATFLYRATRLIDDALSQVTLVVHSCGPPESEYSYSSSQLGDLVDTFNQTITNFFETSSVGRSTIRFELGETFTLDIDWDSQSIRAWSSNTDPYFINPCSRHAMDKFNSPSERSKGTLILADVDIQESSGYARLRTMLSPIGPVVAGRPSETGLACWDDQCYSYEELLLQTIAHEIGHGVYGWEHPFTDEDLTCRLVEDCARVKERLGSEKAGGLMSYSQFGSKGDLSPTADIARRAYVSCYNRIKLRWARKVGGTCEQPSSPTLTTPSTTLPTTTVPPTSTTVSTSESNHFLSVSAGSYSCGLRTDNTIICWGEFDHLQVPEGQYKAVSTGGSHSCGLRTNNTITCWGNNRDGRSGVPAGQYKAVSAGSFHSCGLRTDNTIACWGHNLFGQSDAPKGRFKAVSAGTEHSCGLRGDDTITCWGRTTYPGQFDAEGPEGQYKAVSIGGAHSCGLRTDNTITCWGDNLDGQLNVSEGQYTAVSVGSFHSCGLRTDSTITCWGFNDFGQTDVPGGSYKAVSAGSFHSCGLRANNTIVCWGGDSPGDTDVPTGQS